MANVQTNSPDWAWPALIQTLQQDIARLHAAVDTLRHEHHSAREHHQAEIGRLVEQLREVQQQLEPIVEDRTTFRDDRREVSKRWFERAGWGLLLAVGYAVWHYLSNHLNKQ